jgi:hypothetical protein
MEAFVYEHRNFLVRVKRLIVPRVLIAFEYVEVLSLVFDPELAERKPDFVAVARKRMVI